MLTTAVAVSACDAGETAAETPFSLTVTVTDRNGDPAAGREIGLVHGVVPFRPSAGSEARGLVRTSAADLSPVAPTPCASTAEVTLRLGEVSTVHLDVVDLGGEVRQTVSSASLAAGVHRFQLRGVEDGGAVLPGGVYRLRAVVDGDTLIRTTVRTEGFADPDLVAFGRRIGTTTAAGTTTSTDQTMAVSLYDLPPVEIVDRAGNTLGNWTIPQRAEIVVRTRDGGEVRHPITLSDGANQVAVRLL